jgi:hypothetical protein
MSLTQGEELLKHRFSGKRSIASCINKIKSSVHSV